MITNRVVITGMGVVAPNGNGLDAFWNALTSGITGIKPITSFDTAELVVKFGGEVKNLNFEEYINPKELRRMDRFTWLVLVASEMAIRDAGIDFSLLNQHRCGVIVGSGIGGLDTIEKQNRILVEKGPKRISPFMIPMQIINMAAGYVSIQYGLKGPSTSVVTACASGTNAIGDAFKIIQRGDADVMVVGGTEAALTTLGIGGFTNLKALSTRNDEPEKASRPFDAQRDGFVMGEGSGMVILESLESAQKRGVRIYAEVVGYGMTSDAFHITQPDPNGDGAAAAMKMAINDAGLQPEDVDYINAHGTSTVLNDKGETLAIKKVFGEHATKLAISSTKSMTGHLLGAAGGVECIASAMTIHTGVIHPTINYEFPDPECDLDYVPNQARKQEVRTALSNSFGFGGHNATLLLKKYTE